MKKLSIFTALLLILLTAFTAQATEQNKIQSEKRNDTENELQGVYYYRIEPSFYTGFAPRCQEPNNIHIHLGRGNQVRVTLVLSNPVIDSYLPDLAFRYHVYDELIKTSKIKLTQNLGFEKFARIIKTENIVKLAGERNRMNPRAYRKISLEILEKLNPGRVFHIHINFDQQMHRWSIQLAPFLNKKPSIQESLALINNMLPTRMWVSELPWRLKDKLKNAIALYGIYEEDLKSENAWKSFYHAAVELFEAAANNIYPFNGKMLDFYEFTAVYPVGTLNQMAKYDGRNIPLYPCPGKRNLIHHQRTKVVDHIPDKVCYGYLPWLPYMHVGKTLHNSFHTLWFQNNVKRNTFIPKEWKQNTKNSRTGKPYPYLWLLSRGPMSHGCTHVNAGHISELRQMLPSDEKALPKVVTYRNKSNHFDVFDIDGDGRPEVMGVKYYHAYSLKHKKPYKRRAPADRKSFYKWLYVNGYRYDADGGLVFDQAPTSRFVRKNAYKGETYENIPLYEAEYTPETLQFYNRMPIPFVRELRRISSTYDHNRKVLKLDKK
ncbi:MAG: hypothetical protein B6240_10225 [Desulfobacteraceae bacterium 4572_87]|nr:MAG: hypothetical protein B6240_10225 [Desulfobacteraceae bacterium 4572_87]